jgi:hypothetical protein
MFNGRRQPSRGGTSRMTRECQVRICEGLGVKFPGPTRLVSRASPVQTACATVREMKEGPSGSAIRSLIPSHRELLRSKAMVVSVAENSGR